MQTTEERVAQTLLEMPTTITIGGYEHPVAPPTIGTLALMSAEISRLTSEGNDLQSILRDAKDNAKALTRIGAIAILGAKKIRERGDDHIDKLGRMLFETASVGELANLITIALEGLDISGFFVLTTSLKGANLLKPTKSEVVAEAIASGD